MKKFKFSLEKLLSYKNQILDGEMQKLSQLTAEQRACESEIISLTNEKIQNGRLLEEKLRESISPMDAITYDRYIEKLRGLIESAEIRLENIKIQIEKQREVITEAKKECRSLEILKDNRYHEYLEEERKSQEREIEEFVSAAEALAKLEETS